MECWLFGPEMDIFAYLHSPSSGEEAPQSVQAALARMPKKEDSLELGREVGREGGRKKNGGHGPRIIS